MMDYKKTGYDLASKVGGVPKKDYGVKGDGYGGYGSKPMKKGYGGYGSKPMKKGYGGKGYSKM